MQLSTLVLALLPTLSLALPAPQLIPAFLFPSLTIAIPTPHPTPTSLLDILPSISLSLPTPPPKPTPSTSTKFTLEALFGYIPTPPAPNSSPDLEQQQQAWVAFQINDGEYETLCSAFSTPNTTLFSENAYFPCDVDEAHPDVKFWFRIEEGFKGIGIKKLWESRGTYMIGFADQTTNWTGGEGGNMTVGEYGTTYERYPEWEFEITRIIA